MTTLQMELLQGLNLASMSDNLKRAVIDLQEGKIVLLLDAHERENEGDLIVAAEKITPLSMNFLIKKGSGVVCLALPEKRLNALDLPLMIPNNTNFFGTAFTVSIEAKTGVTTGVSAKDRSHTVLVAMADDAEPSHLARPGHVFPLAAQKNGVFDRMGHTEGSVDLMKIAGLKPGAVLCELMNEDGSMTIGQKRMDFAREFSIPVVTIEEIFCHRMRLESVFELYTKKCTNTRFGDLTWHSFRFFDKTTIDIFYKSSFLKAHDTKITLISGDNLSNRYMAQILEHSLDDPLFFALKSLTEGKTDCALMITTDNPGNKHKGEIETRVSAMVCRALCELSIKNMVLHGAHAEMIRIAREHFSLNVSTDGV